MYLILITYNGTHTVNTYLHIQSYKLYNYHDSSIILFLQLSFFFNIHANFLAKIYYLSSQFNCSAFYRIQLIIFRFQRRDVNIERNKNLDSYITSNLPGCFGCLDGDGISSQIIAFLLCIFHGLSVLFLDEELNSGTHVSSICYILSKTNFLEVDLIIVFRFIKPSFIYLKLKTSDQQVIQIHVKGRPLLNIFIN